MNPFLNHQDDERQSDGSPPSPRFRCNAVVACEVALLWLSVGMISKTPRLPRPHIRHSEAGFISPSSEAQKPATHQPRPWHWGQKARLLLAGRYEHWPAPAWADWSWARPKMSRAELGVFSQGSASHRVDHLRPCIWCIGDGE